MGADLYIKDIYETAQKKYRVKFESAARKRDELDAAGDKAGSKKMQKAIERYDALMHKDGYFRDSYNNSSVLNRLGLSWWKDVTPKLDKGSNLDVGGCIWLIEQVKARKIRKVTKAEMERGIDIKDLKNAGWNMKNVNQRQVDSWNRYFVAKKKLLITFLQRAVKAHTPVECSL